MDTLPTFQNLPTYATPQAAPTSTLDLYCFDDLLVTCCKEIITNGFDSNHIPSTIKDWLSGKIMKALPQKLVQKLLSYILENRDLSDFISYKENSTGEEFTLYLYKSFAQRKRLEAQKKRAQTQLQPHQALDQFPPANGDTSATQSATQSLESKITNIFNEVTQKQQHDFNMETMDFYEEELIVEPKPASIKEALEKYNVLSENYLLESKKQASRSRDTSKYAMNEETLDRDFPTLDDDDIDTLKNSNKSVRLDLKAQRRKRKHDSGGNVTADDDSQDDGEFEADAQARTCKLCGKTYTRKTSLLLLNPSEYCICKKPKFGRKKGVGRKCESNSGMKKVDVIRNAKRDGITTRLICNCDRICKLNTDQAKDFAVLYHSTDRFKDQNDILRRSLIQFGERGLNDVEYMLPALKEDQVDVEVCSDFYHSLFGRFPKVGDPSRPGVHCVGQGRIKSVLNLGLPYKKIGQNGIQISEKKKKINDAVKEFADICKFAYGHSLEVDDSSEGKIAFDKSWKYIKHNAITHRTLAANFTAQMNVNVSFQTLMKKLNEDYNVELGLREMKRCPICEAYYEKLLRNKPIKERQISEQTLHERNVINQFSSWSIENFGSFDEGECDVLARQKIEFDLPKPTGFAKTGKDNSPDKENQKGSSGRSNKNDLERAIHSLGNKNNSTAENERLASEIYSSIPASRPANNFFSYQGGPGMF